MNVHTFHTWGCKNEEKKKSIKPPFPKGVSVRVPVWIPYGAFHPLPTEFPYGFQYGSVAIEE
jgi:hypothetical protein